jgi:hypothetical protein
LRGETGATKIATNHRPDEVTVEATGTNTEVGEHNSENSDSPVFLASLVAFSKLPMEFEPATCSLQNSKQSSKLSERPETTIPEVSETHSATTSQRYRQKRTTQQIKRQLWEQVVSQITTHVASQQHPSREMGCPEELFSHPLIAEFCISLFEN